MNVIIPRLFSRIVAMLAVLAVTPAGLAAEPGPDAAPATPAAEGVGLVGGAAIGDGSESLQVIVGPGGSSRETIAIPEVRCAGGASATLCRKVSQILRKDMTLSFIFKVLPPRSYLADPEAEPVTAPQWSDWSNVGARYLIRAEITGAGPYNVEFRFFDVDGKRALSVDGQSVKGLGKAELRKATHRFANGVLKAKTGRAGVFDSRIVYSKKLGLGVKGIGITGMDGAGKTMLISNGSINTLPTWGFGGVLYTSFLNGHPQLFFGKRRLSRDAGHYRKAAVSPDGSKVIASISYGGQSDLYLMQKDGTVIRNLTNSGADEVSPTFSPDGQTVAFVSSETGSPQIYAMPVAGGARRRLTFEGAYNYSPDWGPNGLIVFAGMDDGISDIFTVNVEGVIKRLTQDQGFNKDPTWSGDGRYVGFYSRREAGSGIYLMSANGRYQLLVGKGTGVGNLAWER